VYDQVAAGHPVDGLFPPNAEWKRKYQEHQQSHAGQDDTP
jgi:hypothetical protein